MVELAPVPYSFMGNGGPPFNFKSSTRIGHTLFQSCAQTISTSK